MYTFWRIRFNTHDKSHYSWWLVPEARRQKPEKIQEGQQALMQIVLVDADAGILQAMHIVSLPTDFSQVLTDAILQQIDGPEITPKAYAVITASVQSQYSSAQLQAIASIRCKLSKLNRAKGFG